MSRVPITIEGEIALKDELSKLKFIERPKISEAIAEARAHGERKRRIPCGQRASGFNGSKNK